MINYDMNLECMLIKSHIAPTKCKGNRWLLWSQIYCGYLAL